ncbi:MAG: DUF3108 domain-containing protein, partial [Rhodospirillales bacterium]
MVKRIIPLAVFLALTAGSAWAADHERLRYEANWGGFHAADLVLDQARDDAQLLTSLAMETRGLVRWLIHLRFDALGEGTVAEEGARSLAYKTEFANRKGSRRLELAFDPKTGRAELVKDLDLSSEPSEAETDPETVEPVPMEARLGSLDPLTALIRLQENTRLAAHGQGPKSFVIPVFDGRRRYDFASEVLGAKQISVEGKPYQTIEVRLSMTTLQGFRPK